MNRRHVLAFSLALPLVALGLAPLSLCAAKSPAGPVALIVGLQGEAKAVDAAKRETVLRLFDKLEAGTTLRTGAASTLRVVFSGGARFTLGERSQARIGKRGLYARKGSVTVLKSLPAGLSIAPIAPGDSPGDHFPTIVVRAEPIAGVYPRGIVTLPLDQAVLHFGPVAGAPRYRVSVSEQKSGNEVFTEETRETTIELPSAKLKPGRLYLWSVATVDRVGPKAEGRGSFRTSTVKTEKARAELDRTLDRESPLDALLVKIAVDLNLGRYREVYAELRQAQDLSPHDETLKSAVEAWRQRLELKEGGGGA